MTIIELTCCFESNLKKSREYKIDRYRCIEEETTIPINKCNKIFVEITNTGFVGKDIREYTKIFKGTDVNTKRMIEKMMEVAIRCSFYIYTRRSAKWNKPNLLTFY